MRLPILGLTLLAIQSASATSLPNDRAQLTTFSLSASESCHHRDSIAVAVPYGSACGRCTAVPTSGKAQTMRSVSITSLDPRCRVTLFRTADCAGEGIAPWAGGCWNPEGGVMGYKVDCPWYDASGKGPEMCKGESGQEVKELRRRQDDGECLAEQDNEDDVDPVIE